MMASMDSSSVQETPQQKIDQSVKKKKWNNKVEFFLAVLGYSIGMGSLTRFPYLCMKNGGGAFLIPWIFALIFGGIPLFYLELALGQFSGLSPLTMWTLCPAFKGIGYACAILSGIVSIYYNMQLGWCLLYLVKSLASDVPWRGCDHWFNSDNCYDPFSTSCQKVDNSTASLAGNFTNGTCYHPEDFVLPSEDFWNNVILGTNGKGLEDVGSLRWQLVLCLFAAWLMVFLCLMKGVQSLGKVVYVTATGPYFLLTALVIRGATLEGASDGIIYYLKPNFTELANHNVWIEASLSMFYSLGPAWGGIVTMASHNHFHHRFNIDAVVISTADIFTAFYAGFAVFSVAGFMAHRSKMPIKNLSLSGYALSFVVFPQAIAEMPVSPLWSILFFLTIASMGIDSQFGMVDTVLGGIFDFNPNLRRHKILITGIVSALFFILGLPFATQGGMYLYVLFDWYAAAITLTVVAFLESVIIAYVYGLVRFSDDIRLMLGYTPGTHWKFLWLVATPLFMATLLFVGLWNLQPPSYQGYEYPGWGVAIGWLVSFVSFAPIPGFAIYAFIKSPYKSTSKRLASIFLPSEDWIPAKEELVDSYRAKYSKAKRQNKEIHCNNDRCPFCQATGFDNKTVKCQSIFKCWVCFCTCQIFVKNNEQSVNKHPLGEEESGKNNYGFKDDDPYLSNSPVTTIEKDTVVTAM